MWKAEFGLLAIFRKILFFVAALAFGFYFLIIKVSLRAPLTILALLEGLSAPEPSGEAQVVCVKIKR